mgnify:FL=1
MKVAPFSPAQKGFTLLELLLAMTLGALIMAGIGRFLAQAFALSAGQEGTASALADLSQVSAKLASQLRCAQLYEGREDLFFLAAGSGEDAALLFTCKRGRELKLVGWAVAGGELYYLETNPGAWLPQSGQLPEPRLLLELGARMIAASITGLTFEFSGAERYSWDSRQLGLPGQVRLVFTTAVSPQGRELVVTLPQGRKSE